MTEHADPNPYELERPIAPPDLPGQVIVRDLDHDVIGALAADLLVHAHNCVRAFGDFHMCLTGDPSIEPVLLRLLTDPAHRDLPWRRTQLWLFSEHLGSESEFDLIRETIAIHADLPSEQTHAIDAGHTNAADRYEQSMKETLAWREKGHDRLDYVLLTPASIPSGWAMTGEGDALVRVYADRVACTKRLINASRFISVFAIGAGARDAITESVDRRHAMASIAPVGGSLRWYLDRDACPSD